MKLPAFSIRAAAGRMLAASIALAATATAAPRFVVKVADRDGSIRIAGESSEPGHEGWIDAVAFGQGLQGTVAETFVGRTGFTFHKRVDASSPYLALAVMEGESFPSVIIEYLGQDGEALVGAPVRVELNHVRISDYQVAGGRFDPLPSAGNGRPTEQVTLVWSQVVLHYSGFDEAGRLVERIEGGHTAYPSTGDPWFDDDGDGLANHLDPDDDNDAIDDGYETANGLDPFLDDAAGDLDGDKRTNYDEAVADTRANDAGDFFRIDSLVYRHTPDGPQAAVTLRVKPGRRYQLLATPDLAQPRDSWIVADQFEVSEADGAGPVEIILKGPLVANAARLFFSAEVDLAEPAAP